MYSVTVCISNSETDINDTFNLMVELINTNKEAELALTNDVFTASCRVHSQCRSMSSVRVCEFIKIYLISRHR